MSNLVLRTIFGALFVVVLVASMVLSAWSFVVLFALITALAVWEFSGIVNQHAGAMVNRLQTTTAGVYLFLAFAAYNSGLTGAEAFVPYLLFVVYLPISELYLQKPDPLKNWAYAFAAQIYIALPFALLNTLGFVGDTLSITSLNQYHFILPLSIFIFLWTNDTGAYCTGSLLHKTFPAKLFERISPNKSWVGSIGGAVLSLLVAVLLNAAFPGNMSLLHWLGFALVVVIFGTWGDLVESMLKRQLGIKDSGHILPGHGGMLDRFDSMLLAVPAVVIYLYTIHFF